MNDIKLLNKIAKVGLDKLDPEKFNVGEDIEAPSGIMVRSANLLDMTFNPELCAIARAGAGVNNVPIDRCSKDGIVVFNTPGANANAVKELVICGLMLASRNVVGGVEWAKTLNEDVAKQVEKGKSQFGGVEIYGKTLGVIGLGAIGSMVADAAAKLGMNVVGCDPYISAERSADINENVKLLSQYDDVYARADYLTLHVPSTPSTKGMINKDNIEKMKDGVRILNFSRADLVCADDMKTAMEGGKVAAYVTDFPTEQVLSIPNVVAIPHLGASTAEAEDNCAIMAAEQLSDYILNGNIKNSVNFPSISMPRTTDSRLCILHKSDADLIAKVAALFAQQGIENVTTKVRGEVAYTLMDLKNAPCADAVCELRALDAVIKVRIV